MTTRAPFLKAPAGRQLRSSRRASLDQDPFVNAIAVLASIQLQWPAIFVITPKGKLSMHKSFPLVLHHSNLRFMTEAAAAFLNRLARTSLRFSLKVAPKEKPSDLSCDLIDRVPTPAILTCVMSPWRFLLFVSTTIGLCAAPVLDFEWMAPAPHRLNWIDMVGGNGRFVGIASIYETVGRDVYSSKDGHTWVRRDIPSGVVLSKIDFCNGMFIGLGFRDGIITSLDGETWTLRRINGAVGAAAAGNGITVLVGADATILSSTDMQNWNRAQGLGSGYHFVAVAFGNGRFIAVGEFGRVFTSVDGANWTPGTWPADARKFE